MPVRLKPLNEQVIVITGASSGIGLTTARMAAKAGARLVLSSRNDEALRKLVGEIQAAGGQAIPVVADVGDLASVRAISDAAIGRFGGFDTWINNAGTSIYGRILDTPLEEQRRLFETNYWGVVHGSIVAAPHLAQRGGALINIGSVVSERTVPLQGTYSATKHAVKAFTDALRMELEEEGAPVAVTLIKPTSIDTPFTRHARSHLPAAPEFPPPVYDPVVVAKAILLCAVSQRRDVLVGGAAKLFSLMEKLMPRTADRYMEKTVFRQQIGDRPNQPTDHLDAPTTAEGEERGDHQGRVLKHSAYTATALHPAVATSVAVGVVGLVAAVLANRGRGGARTRGGQSRDWSALEDQSRVAHAGRETRELQESARADRLGLNEPDPNTSPYEFVP